MVQTAPSTIAKKNATNDRLPFLSNKQKKKYLKEFVCFFLCQMDRGEVAEEMAVSEEAYLLWRNNFSSDAKTNWLEAERRIRERSETQSETPSVRAPQSSSGESLVAK